jgi:hypothetical protein
MPAYRFSQTPDWPRLGIAHQAVGLALWVLLSGICGGALLADPRPTTALLDLATDLAAGLVVCLATKSSRDLAKPPPIKLWLGIPLACLIVVVLALALQETEVLATTAHVGLRMAIAIPLAFVVQPVFLTLVLAVHQAVRRGRKEE